MTPRTVGALIALFERAVSIYALLVNINAYHQPGVEAGKKAAGIFLDLLQQVKGSLTTSAQTADQVAESISANPEDVYHCLTHLASNGFASVSEGESPASDSFVISQ